MDMASLKRLKSTNSLAVFHEQDKLIDKSRIKIDSQFCEGDRKNILIIYASGSMGANKDLQIERDGLKKFMSTNFYLCDLEETRKQSPSLQFLISPSQQAGFRIRYKIVQLPQIDNSINIKMQDINQIVQIIQQNYHQNQAFIIVTGLDTICHLGTMLSFMLENLSKLVICTGGYLPLSRMRNDSVSNLVECFTVVAQATSLNQVIIVNKNKGFRANRCIKMFQGDFQNISSPNLQPLCSIKTNMRVRSYLFQPKPLEKFSIFQKMSNKVKVIRLNQYESLQSLRYDLKNPFVKGIVIEGYSFANLPNQPELLNLFKEAHEDEQRRIIFVNISEAIFSKNDSLMKNYLQQFHIYYGGDMTTEAALTKLSYLIGKGFQVEEIIRMIKVNMRGELTQEKQKSQFKAKQVGMMEVVDQVLNDYFPTSSKDHFFNKIQDNVSKYIINKYTVEQFSDVFKNARGIGEISDNHNLLHIAVASNNRKMVEFLIQKGAKINQEDENSCSPLFYALKNRNKPLIQLLRKNGGRVISFTQEIFEIMIQAIQKDDIQFFNLLYHTEFKETLKNLKNFEQRTIAHIAALMKSHKIFNLIKQKFNVPINQEDIYNNTAMGYFERKVSFDLIFQ